jgi:heme exporter protein D
MKTSIITAANAAAGQWVVYTLLIIFVVATAILALVLFRIKRRERILREKISQQLRDKEADDEKLSTTLSRVMQIVIGIMDCISLSPENATLLHSKVRSYFLTTLRDKGNVFYEMDYLADKCQCGLITRLKEEHPSLTKDDVMLCSLISLGFPTHAIATIFRLTNEMSIYNKRERLRTRLEMEEGSNLMDYLDDKAAMLRSQKALLYSNIFSSLGKKGYI